MTIREGAEKPLAKCLSMVAGDGNRCRGGPACRSPSSSRVHQPERFADVESCRDIGVNVDAAPRILASGKITVRLKLNFLTVFRV